MGPTVLVIDSEPTVLRFITLALEISGYFVISVQSAAEARQVIASTPHIDLFTADVVSAPVDVPALIQDLQITHPSCKVLCITAQGPVEVERSAAIDASTPVLYKPFTCDALRQAVRHVLGRKARAA